MEAHSYSDRRGCYTRIFFASIPTQFSPWNYYGPPPAILLNFFMCNSLIIIQDDTSHETREKKHFHQLNRHRIQYLPNQNQSFYHLLSLSSYIYGPLVRSYRWCLSDVRYGSWCFHLVSWSMKRLYLIRREKTKQLFKLSFYV
jgi:hypothetical protein